MITQITKAYVRTYSDSGQVTAYVEWTDARGRTGRTEGHELNPHMQALFTRAKRESVRVERQRWPVFCEAGCDCWSCRVQPSATAARL